MLGNGIVHLIRGKHRREHGQIVVLAALLMTAMLGFTAIAVDVGFYMRNLRDGQNDIDAAVLAGAQELLNDPTDTAAAVDRAEEWATRNGVAAGDLKCCTFSASKPGGEIDTVSGRIERSSDTLFARVLGIESLPVERESTARVVHARGATICPWGLVGDESDTDPNDGSYLGVVPGQVYALKVMTGLQTEGNFRVLDLGQSGAEGYQALIEAGCTAEGVRVWSEGDQILTDPKPGNMGNPTRKALDNYYQYEKSDGTSDSLGYGWCDVAYELDPADPTRGTVVGAYNPYLQGAREGCERNPLTGGMGRVVLIPIIDHIPNGASEPVTILGLASLYIAYWDRTGSPANTQVYGIFLDQGDVSPKDLVGESDNPLAPLRVVLHQ
jgi:hypothetical protein